MDPVGAQVMMTLRVFFGFMGGSLDPPCAPV